MVSPLGASSLRGTSEHRRKGFKPKAYHGQSNWRGSSSFAMKKRSLSLGGRPGPLSHAAQSQFSHLVPTPGCDSALRPINSLRAEITQSADCGLQQDSQSKHPFLPRSGQPCSSPSQRSLSQGYLTQSQDTQQFSQNSQPEDYSCDQWTRRGFQEKEISHSQRKPPSPYFAGLTSSLNRRNASGTVGGGSTPVSSTCTSSALCLVAPQSNTPRPWPQCNISEELEKRLGSLEKLREDETALLQKNCDDYQQIKIFLEETCFESKDNRSKLALQQNALHKLLKEEETANSTILSAIKTSGEAILESILINFKQAVEESEVVNKSIVSANFECMIESVREEIVNFKRDLKAELHEMKQSVPIELVREEIMNFKRDLRAELHEMKQSMSIGGMDLQLPNPPFLNTDMHHYHPNQSLDSRMDLTESTPKHSLEKSSLLISMSNVVDLDEILDSDLDTGFAFSARDRPYAAHYKRRKQVGDRFKTTDNYIHKSSRAKMLRGRKRMGLPSLA